MRLEEQPRLLKVRGNQVLVQRRFDPAFHEMLEARRRIVGINVVERAYQRAIGATDDLKRGRIVDLVVQRVPQHIQNDRRIRLRDGSHLRESEDQAIGGVINQDRREIESASATVLTCFESSPLLAQS